MASPRGLQNPLRDQGVNGQGMSSSRTSAKMLWYCRAAHQASAKVSQKRECCRAALQGARQDCKNLPKIHNNEMGPRG